MTADPGAGTPIACSLDAGSFADRVDEWRALVTASVVKVEAEPTGVSLVLEASGTAMVAAVELAQREKQCCPFFDVTLEIGAEQYTLTLRVPDGAEEAMATFVAMVTR
jgi:MerR family transcriptional regulator, copper efflux regulator